ncbi:protease modulator HflC [Desulfocurvibacter africanus]|uniref:Protein HflC n=1 Tax=Desulfocurvibacter africanus subsp. africanus str. Walvis Bay TaxID=690850 RepID=F3YUG1_DESAF|nr:protease modulator HflC [Desulfocurvibacter africanus]EGJ48843.1 HflC protein [Desulfocurvibacter africanus subsp. africanus str. Walvis Bay]
MRTKLIIPAVIGFLALIALVQSMFMVDQTERAIVLELGKPVGDKPLEPGLHFKLPFVQNVVFFDSRILNYDAEPAEILTRDKKNMVVDNYTKWRITDPLLFYRTVRSIPRAQARLDDIIYSEIRVALGNYTLIEIVSGKRGQITQEVTTKSNALVSEYGIEVMDVRIKRTDLPAENARAIFGRMRAERERQAKQYRSEGQEESSKITALADRERTILQADARRQASVLRGEGEAEAIRLWADALGRDPEFYAFQRSLEAYEKSLKENSRLVLTPDSPFFKYLR